MTDIADPDIGDRPAKKGKILKLLVPVVALGAGFASTYLGVWSPMALVGGAPAPAQETHDPVPSVAFVDVPRIVLTVPGERTQTLALTVMIEVPPDQKSQALALMPRIIDAYNGFLSRIDATAFGRRGILEIIRTELATRTRFILGDAAVRDLLITEFRIQ